MKDEKNIHSGHRVRLNELILNVGVENVSDIQAVEGFLTLIVPRVDVNPLAHSLLEHFGNFSNILDAEISDLEQVKGLSHVTATKIKNFRQYFTLYTITKMKKRLSVKDNKQFYYYLEQLLRYEEIEFLYIFAIDNAYRIKQMRKKDLDSIRETGVSPYEVMNLITSTHAKYLIIAHNHPNGRADRSDTDSDATNYISHIAEPYSCTVLDSFVVGQDGIYSEKQQSYAKKFDDDENLLDGYFV